MNDTDKKRIEDLRSRSQTLSVIEKTELEGLEAKSKTPMA